MRVAHDDNTLKTGLVAAQQEVEKAFKECGAYLEKYIERPRHVEVQLLGDKHGNVIDLWERDFTLQRRHQKLVEESRAPHLHFSVREEICEAAVRRGDNCAVLLDDDI